MCNVGVIFFKMLDFGSFFWAIFRNFDFKNGLISYASLMQNSTSFGVNFRPTEALQQTTIQM